MKIKITNKQFEYFYNDCLSLLSILKYEVENSNHIDAFNSFEFLTELYSDFKNNCKDEQYLYDIKSVYKSYLKKIEVLDEEGEYTNKIENLRKIL